MGAPARPRLLCGLATFLHPLSIPSVPAQRLHALQFGQINFGDGAQHVGRRALLQALRQGLQPSAVVLLERHELGHRVAPALRLGAPIGRLAVLDPRRRRRAPPDRPRVMALANSVT